MSESVQIFVDGSFIKNSCGYGAVVIVNGTVVHEISGKVIDDDFSSHRQVGGEIISVIIALEWCRTNGYSSLEIFYDYKGVADWATKTWKANKVSTKLYQSYFDNAPFKIKWSWVKSHTGNKYNDAADALAKKGAYSQNTDESDYFIKQLKSNKTTKSVKVTAPAALKKVPATIDKPAKSTDKNLLINELNKVAENFIIYLRDHKIDAKSEGVKNGMYNRIVILNDAKKSGIVDIYNTMKKRFTPDFRAFSDTELQKNIHGLYVDFFKSK